MNTRYFILNEITQTQNKKRNIISGTILKKEKNNSEQMLIKCKKTLQSESKYANIVEQLLQHNIHSRSFVKNIRNLRGIRKQLVLLMAFIFGKRKMVCELLKPVHIVAVGNYEDAIVYRLTVEEAHLYYANGILVSNTQGEDHSYDALSYMLKAIRWVDAKLGGVERKGMLQSKVAHVQPDRPIPLTQWN
jgi:hypothetical protein